VVTIGSLKFIHLYVDTATSAQTKRITTMTRAQVFLISFIALTIAAVTTAEAKIALFKVKRPDRGSAVMLNPQPLPPKEKLALNPQPLPPRR
jgi:hypothetical protein